MAKRPQGEIKEISDIEKILSFCDSGGYIFRGEQEEYERIDSGLYREYSKGENPLTSNKNFSVLYIEKDIIDIARKHVRVDASDIEVLTELQHYGGNTALIDFTESLYVALFFACDGDSSSKDGRLILVKSGILARTEINYRDALMKIRDENILAYPAGKNPRAIFQSSVFIHPRKGYLEEAHYELFIIKSSLKKSLLKYLQEYHNIYRGTIYNDIHGFIRDQENHRSAALEFYRGYACSESGKYEEAITHYTNVIGIDPNHVITYSNRGDAYCTLGKYEKGMSDCNKALEIDSDYAQAYGNRGNIHFALKEYEKSIKDYNKARELYIKQGNISMAQAVDQIINRVQLILPSLLVPPKK